MRLAPTLKFTEEGFSLLFIGVSDSAAFGSWVRENRPAWALKSRGPKVFTLSDADNSSIEDLASAPGVLFIDNGARTAKEETVLGDFDITLNSASTVHALYPALTGENITISIKEKPFDINDLDLRGRVKINEQFDEPSTLHATIMATVAAGAGNTSSFGRGVASGASVTTSDFASLLPDAAPQLAAMDVSVQNHSYGVGVENYYGLEASEYDRSSRESPHILHVFSAGNAGESALADGYYRDIPGSANLTGQFKTSKNTISVGSSNRYGEVATMSSKGPAYDGRVKPEVIAFGDAGASEASAVVAGVGALLQEVFRTRHVTLPDAALIKGVLVNSADDAGRPHVDFETGFGNVNALRAVRTLMEDRFYRGSVSQNEEIVFDVAVPFNQKLLKITLVWNDPPAEPFSSKALVNDLDLSVHTSNTFEPLLPWVLETTNTSKALRSPARRGIDTLNNIEQVTVENPEAGTYQVKVRGTTVSDGAQSFYVVFEWASGFELLHPVKSSRFRANRTNVIRWSWFDLPAEGKLEFKFASDDHWHVISESVQMAARYYEWVPPDTTGLIQIRFSVGTIDFGSDVIALSRPKKLQVGFNCEKEVLFLWPEDPSASAYTLYRLGEKYLEPVFTSADTFAIVTKNESATNYYSMAPLYGDQPGDREATIDYNSQGVGCYFKSFLPRENIVTEEAIFDVGLATTYNLKSAALERYTNGAFETIQTIGNITNNELTFTDPVMRSDLHSYRVKLKTNDGTVVYSDAVEILFLQSHEVYVYPNPAAAGLDRNIIVSDETPTEISLYDLHGRLVRQFEDFGLIKTINTQGLPSGTYVLRMLLQNGKIVTARIVLL